VIRHLEARVAIQSRDSIGEAPTWDAENRRLLWVDHAEGTVHEAKSDDSGRLQESRQWNLGRPVAAAIPRSKGGLIVASGSDILTWDEANTLVMFARINSSAPLFRISDAKCDRRGRLWASGLTTDFRPQATALYRIDTNGEVTTALEGVTLGNGLDWSPDGSTFYFIDSWTRRVDRFDFDEARGTIANRSTLLDLDRGIPNGMTVDCEGCLWVAATGAGQIRRYSSDGILLAHVEVSTPGVTSCGFGGLECADLFITSRSGRLPEIATRLGVTSKMMEDNSPQAGALFVCPTAITGIPGHPFAG
jgi:sugar lactone lactonase YvrE